MDAIPPTPVIVSGRRSRVPFFAAGALVLVIVVGALAFAASSLLFPSFKAAAYLPRDTWLVAAVTMRPGLLQASNIVGVVDAFKTQPGYEDALRRLERQAGSKTGDVHKEVLALLDGEVAIGVYGSTTSPSAVALFHSSDPQKLVQVFAKAAGLPEPRDKYRDGLSFVQRGTQDSVYIASPKGWVVLGSPRSAAEKAYDRIDAGGSDSLDGEPRYRSVIDRLPADRVGHVYWDLRSFASDSNTRRSFEQLPPQFRDRVLDQLNSRSAMSLQAVSEGLEFRVETILDKPQSAKPELAKGNTLTALDRLPRTSLVAFAGNSLPTLVSGLDTAASDFLRGSLGARAPKIEFQFSSWLGGEFALGVGPGDLRFDRGLPGGNVDVVFAAKLKDPAAASSDVSSLDTLLSAKNTTVKGFALKQVSAGSQSITYGVGGDWLYALFGTKTDSLLPPAQGRTDGLTTSENFGLVRRVIKEDSTIFYVDLENGRRLLEDSLTGSQRGDYDGNVRVFLQPLRAVASSTRTDPNGDVHGELLIAIKR